MSAVHDSLVSESTPPSEIKIRLTAAFANRFWAAASPAAFGGPGEVRGVLFGRADDGYATIQGFPSGFERTEDDASPHRTFTRMMEVAGSDPEGFGLDVIGWYALRSTSGLQPADIEFHNAFFGGDGKVFLLARETEGNLVFDVYSAIPGESLSSRDHLSGTARVRPGTVLTAPLEVVMHPGVKDEFYLRVYGVDEDEPQKTPPRNIWNKVVLRTPPALAQPPSGLPAPASPEKPPVPSLSFEGEGAYESARELRQRRSQSLVPQNFTGVSRTDQFAAESLQPLALNAHQQQSLVRNRGRSKAERIVFSAAVFVLAACCTFGFVRFAQNGFSLSSLFGRHAPEQTLGMRLESQGDRLLLSWNRLSPIVKSATAATLEIDDGGHRRDLALRAADISGGAVLYRPNSEDVTFRLSMQGTAGAKVSETIRVLDAKNRATAIDVSQPDPSVRTAKQPDIKQPTPGVASPARKTGSSIQTAQTAPPTSPAVVPSPAAISSETAAVTRPSQPSAGNEPKTQNELVQEKAEDRPATPDVSAPTQLAVEKTSEPAASPVQATPTPIATPPANTQPKSEPAVAPRSIAPGAPPYVPPQPMKQVMPNIQFIAPGLLNPSPRVEVQVDVDANGRVKNVRLSSGQKVNAALASAAVNAAKLWTFRPATLHGIKVASEHTIVFQFQSNR